MTATAEYGEARTARVATRACGRAVAALACGSLAIVAGVVDGLRHAGHTGGLAAAPEAYERRVAGFFDAALLGR